MGDRGSCRVMRRIFRRTLDKLGRSLGLPMRWQVAHCAGKCAGKSLIALASRSMRWQVSHCAGKSPKGRAAPFVVPDLSGIVDSEALAIPDKAG